MSSTYSPNKIYELQSTGENTGTWGTLLNAVLSIIDLNLGGRLELNVAGASDVTLTTTQERNTYIGLSGLLTGNINLIFTATNGGFYLINNRTTGSFTITAKPSGGAGIIIQQSTKGLVMVDPTNPLGSRCLYISTPDVMSTLGDMIYRDTNGVQRLAVGAQGSVLYTNASNPAWLAAGTSGQFLKSQGAAANPVWAAVTSGGLSLLTSGTVSAAATLDLVLTGFTTYRGLEFVLSGFLPVTDNADLWMRFSTDGGSTYISTNTYSFSNMAVGLNYATVSPDWGQLFSAIYLNDQSKDGVGNASNEGYSGIVTLLNQTSTAFYPRILSDGVYISGAATPALVRVAGSGMISAAQDTDAVRFMFSSGNISAGNYAVYGLA